MTAPALIKQADIRRLAAVAKETGMAVEIEYNGLKIRVSADKSTDTPIVRKGLIDL